MLYFVRHGQTDWNREGKIQGSTDVSLNDAGIMQAHQAKKQLCDVKFDRVFCSPLSRTQETCSIIHGGKIETDDRIKERQFGNFEGLYGNEVDFAGMWVVGRETEFPQVEKLIDVKNRVYSFLDEITVSCKDKNVLVVCHGGIAFFFDVYFNGTPEERGTTYKIMNNGEIAVFKI